MASTPRWKVFSPAKQYVACCHFAEDAAALAALYGEGATIRDGHRVKDTVFTEGENDTWAGESYDVAARIVISNAEARYARP